jgi:hypothetical protein
MGRPTKGGRLNSSEKKWICRKSNRVAIEVCSSQVFAKLCVPRARNAAVLLGSALIFSKIHSLVIRANTSTIAAVSGTPIE